MVQRDLRPPPCRDALIICPNQSILSARRSPAAAEQQGVDARFLEMESVQPEPRDAFGFVDAPKVPPVQVVSVHSILDHPEGLDQWIWNHFLEVRTDKARARGSMLVFNLLSAADSARHFSTRPCDLPAARLTPTPSVRRSQARRRSRSSARSSKSTRSTSLTSTELRRSFGRR